MIYDEDMTEELTLYPPWERTEDDPLYAPYPLDHYPDDYPDDDEDAPRDQFSRDRALMERMDAYWAYYFHHERGIND